MMIIKYDLNTIKSNAFTSYHFWTHFSNLYPMDGKMFDPMYLLGYRFLAYPVLIFSVQN